MHGRFATTHIGIVHQVIVQEREVVVYLQSKSRIENSIHIVTIHVISHKHHRRAYALASERENILDRFVQVHRFVCIVKRLNMRIYLIE